MGVAPWSAIMGVAPWSAIMGVAPWSAIMGVAPWSAIMGVAPWSAIMGVAVFHLLLIQDIPNHPYADLPLHLSSGPGATPGMAEDLHHLCR